MSQLIQIAAHHFPDVKTHGGFLENRIDLWKGVITDNVEPDQTELYHLGISISTI